MDWSKLGFPVLHYLQDFSQIHVHWVGDAIQPLHPVSPLSSCPQCFPASWSFPVSLLFTSGGQYWSFSFNISPFNEYSVLISFRIDWFDPFVVQGTLRNFLQHLRLKASNLWLCLSRSYLILLFIISQMKRGRFLENAVHCYCCSSFVKLLLLFNC